MHKSSFSPRGGAAGALWLSALTLAGCFAESHEDEGSIEAGLHPACTYPSTLEITAVNIGQGDATLIATPEAFVLADSGESYWNSHQDALAVDAVMQAKYGCRVLDHVIISHLQVDHMGYVGYGGLYYLANDLGYEIGETILRDYVANVGGTSGTYDNWRAYLATPEAEAALHPRTAILGEQIDLGAGVTLVVTTVDTRSASCPEGWGSAPDGSCGGVYAPGEVLGDHRGESPAPDENDYSISFVLSLGDFDMFIGGDLNGETSSSGFGTSRHDVESYAGRDVGEVDVLKVNHHGSHHSSSAAFVTALEPQAALVSVGNANTYGHSRQVAIDRILDVSGGVPQRPIPMYFTQRGDDGPGGCIPDGTYSANAAGELYGLEIVVSDTDGNYCTIEGGDTDIVVSADGSTFTIEGDLFTSRTGAATPPPPPPPPPPACDGDGVCEAGEDCLSCPNDCVSMQSGKPADRFCCGDGICSGAEPTLSCAIDCGAPPPPPPPAACDADGICDAGESCETCASDCAGVTGGRPGSRYCCGNGSAEAPEGDGTLCDGNY